MTREQAEAIYSQGKEAVVDCLLQFALRLQRLEEQAAKNSGNSSKPPSSDGPGKEPLKPMPRSLRERTGRKPGAQPGHPGNTLRLSDTPDHLIDHRPGCCRNCMADFAGAPALGATRRQVVEMPLPQVVVTEHRAVEVCCPRCGRASRGVFPPEVTHPVQYGQNLLGFATYLHAVHLLPYARCCQIMTEATGASFSPGSLCHALGVASERLGDFETRAKDARFSSPVLHADETGGRVAGKLHWFHVRCTDRLCYLFRHAKRGKEAVDDLRDYSGRLVSDFYGSYVKSSCAHQFCGAHLLRELTFAGEVLDPSWAGPLKAVLERMVGSCHRAREAGLPAVGDAAELREQFDEWVRAGLAQNPAGRVPAGGTRAARGKARCVWKRTGTTTWRFCPTCRFRSAITKPSATSVCSKSRAK